MKFLYTILFISIWFQLKPQSFAPLGAKWTFGISDFWVGWYPTTWTTIKDTMIQGKSCTVSRRSAYATGDVSDHFICYQDSGIVYWYNEIASEFTSFINFNADSGDYWTTTYPYYYNDTCKIRTYVDSTDSVNINGFKLKRLYVHLIDSGGPSYTIIEGIGLTSASRSPYSHGLYPGQHLKWYCDRSSVSDAPEYDGLRCYEDSIIGFVDFNGADDCDKAFYHGILVNQGKSNGQIFPNPNRGLVNIEMGDLKEVSITVFNLGGQLIYHEEKVTGPTHQFELDAEQGFYILEISSQGEKQQFKLIRK